jgi:hypothetical protein
MVSDTSPLWLEGIQDAEMLEETLQGHASRSIFTVSSPTLHGSSGYFDKLRLRQLS